MSISLVCSVLLVAILILFLVFALAYINSLFPVREPMRVMCYRDGDTLYCYVVTDTIYAIGTSPKK